MIDQLIALDRELFLSLNGLHAPWLDPVMMAISGSVIWLPLYAYLLYLIIRDHKINSWLPLLGIGLTILLADQTTSSLMKPFFARLRPSHEPSLVGVIHLVNGYAAGGAYGFASSHAANTFGAATFLTLLLCPTKRWAPWLFVWASIVSYSRIYLGVHYPADIVVGGAIGVLSGWISFMLYRPIKGQNVQTTEPS